MKKYTKFLPRIKSRHPSHRPLRVRGNLPFLPFKSVIRLGSSTEMPDTQDNGGERIELNTTEAVSNSANKLRMKQCFNQNGVKTADWWVYRAGQFFLSGTSDITPIEELSFPVIVKNIYGSRGRGNSKIDSPENLLRFFERHTTHTNYIIEKYYNYSREYRLHVTKNGCFYTCRKMIKADTPDDKRWYRNDSNSVWIIEANDNFDRPTNWDTIVNESVKALNAVGLDFGAVDLKIQSATDEENELRNNPNFIVIEINSAPSFGDLTLERYLTELPKLLKEKYENKTA